MNAYESKRLSNIEDEICLVFCFVLFLCVLFSLPVFSKFVNAFAFHSFGFLGLCFVRFSLCSI